MTYISVKSPQETSTYAFPPAQKNKCTGFNETVRPGKSTEGNMVLTCAIPSPVSAAPFRWSSWELILGHPSLCTLPGNTPAQRPSPYSSYPVQTLDTQNQQLNDHKKKYKGCSTMFSKRGNRRVLSSSFEGSKTVLFSPKLQASPLIDLKELLLLHRMLR